MSFIIEMKEKVLNGKSISYIEAEKLFDQPLDELCVAANEIRMYYCGNIFDICTIINAKSGRCSEDCKYCTQSAHYDTSCEEYPLLSDKEIIDSAKYNSEKGVLRYSLVTSGRDLNDTEIDNICCTIEQMRKTVSISVCGSFGLLNKSQYKRLYKSGVARIHNNLETSEDNFPNMCTTHSFKDKVTAINFAKDVGMSICSGGIFGIGESIKDRVALAFSLKKLEIKSIPINLLNPVKGTPYDSIKPLTCEDMCRIVAVYRFILPGAFIRLAGGRGLLSDKGRSCFLSGANAAISCDMLTTTGISIETDLIMIKELGFEVALNNE